MKLLDLIQLHKVQKLREQNKTLKSSIFGSHNMVNDPLKYLQMVLYSFFALNYCRFPFLVVSQRRQLSFSDHLGNFMNFTILSCSERCENSFKTIKEKA